MVSRGVICLALSLSLTLLVILVILGVLVQRKYKPFTRKTWPSEHERFDDQVASMRNYIENASLPLVFVLCVYSRREIVSFAENVAQAGYTPIIVEDKPKESRSPSSIRHMHVPAEVLKTEGYTQLNYGAGRLFTCAWCAAVWLARNSNRHCWFLEEDVFMCDAESMRLIDASEPNADLVCASHSPPRSDWSHTAEWSEHRPFPIIYSSMVCACRMSPRLLLETQRFAQRNGRLYFLEYFFNSLCEHMGFSVATPPELQTVVFRKDYGQDDIRKNPTFIYHPIKDLSLQTSLRSRACKWPTQTTNTSTV